MCIRDRFNNSHNAPRSQRPNKNVFNCQYVRWGPCPLKAKGDWGLNRQSKRALACNPGKTRFMIHQVAASMIDFAFCQITLVLVIIGGLLAYRLLLFWSSVCRLPGVFALLRDSRTTTCELSTTLSSTLRSSHDSARRLPIHLQPGQQRKPLRHPVSITHCTQLTQHRSGRVLLFLRCLLYTSDVADE